MVERSRFLVELEIKTESMNQEFYKETFGKRFKTPRLHKFDVAPLPLNGFDFLEMSISLVQTSH